MKLQSSIVLRRAKWGLLSALFVVSQFGPLTLLAGTANAGAPKITASDHEGQLKVAGVPGSYSNGNITTYTELDTINYRFTLEADGATTGQMQVEFSENDSKCTFFDGSFALGTWDASAAAVVAVSGATPTVTKAGSSIASGGEWIQKLNVTFSAEGEATVNYYLKLSGEAGECSGSSQHSRLAASSTPGDFANIGKQNVPIPANNIIELPDITVYKYIANDDGTFRTANAGEWSFSLDGQAYRQTDASGKVVFGNVTPDGAHVITESTASGLTLASVTGTNCTIGTAANTATATVYKGTTAQDAVCNFYNRKVVQPTITLIKNVVNNYGGTTASANNFGLSIGGTAVTSGQVYQAQVGQAYAIDEIGLAGYEFTGISGTGCPRVLGQNTTTLTEGQNITCTITNTAIQPRIKVIKHVVDQYNGGKVASDFTMNVTGTDVTKTPGNTGLASSQSFAGSESGTYVYMDAGAFSVSETELPGYAKTTSGDCSGTVTIGDIDKVCTITNTALVPKLTIKKVAINDNGGTITSDKFELFVGSLPGFKNGAPVVDNSKTTSIYPVSGITANTTYTLSETKQSGYTPTNWSCSGTGLASFTQKTDAEKADISLALDADVTCVITNNDDAPALTLVKTLVNNYATHTSADPTESDWLLTANGPQLIQVTGNKDGVKTEDIQQGTYNLSESSKEWADSTYESSWNCVKSSLIASLAKPAPVDSVTLGLGDSYTCTVTNTMKPATLIVEKQVVNDDGGTSVAGDFSFSYTGSTSSASFKQLVSDELKARNNLLLSPGSYTVTEDKEAGYEASYANCDSVVITYGETKTCVVTNDDIAPKLTLLKDVTNNNGGTAEAKDWTLTATPTTNTVGATTISGNGATGVNAVAAKANVEYTLSESGPSGYEYKGWTCTGGNLNGTKLTLALDTNVTCTVKNDDSVPKLTLVKEVTNDNGGKASPSDWTLKADGVTPINGAGGVSSDDTFKAGTYTLSEYDGPSGYKASSWTCTNDVAVNDKNEITVTNTTDTTCTIINDDQKGKIIVIKDVDNNDGRTMTAGDFSVTIGGKVYPFVENKDDVLEGRVEVDVNAGKYSIVENEANQNGYETSYSLGGCEQVYSETLDKLLSSRTSDGCYDECGDGCYGECGDDCGEIDQCDVHVGNGETVYCYIENDDKPVDLSIVKSDAGAITEAGKTYEYTLTVKNESDAPANNVVITDEIPSTISIIDGETGDWECYISGDDVNGFGGTLTCTLPFLDAGETAPVITLVALVADGATGIIENTAVVDSDEKDDNPGNNTSTETTPIKSIKVELVPICRANFPYMGYTVTLTNFKATKATFNWYSVTSGDDLNAVQATQVVNSPIETTVFTGEMLWPGADTTKPDWPGWDYVNGQWVETRNDVGGKLRPNARVEVSVNPIVAEPTYYPGVSGECNPPQELVNTGAGNTTLLSILVAGTMFGGVFAATRRPRAASRA